ncbi:ABC transporter permease subunit [candidate division KSB3 bacterium]|uniref:ABC transporter permease subunit n=1 Tax=candidate division KSB3 bacterium TaxID=2044937 RepID=A0A9D5JSK0_9BACT|nr:ABC transporter permease subunit [candidate division KSB3 bacterium]MBD3323478.1 ABC transporter permease subunit [candidate division KSB3 bacterium]
MTIRKLPPRENLTITAQTLEKLRNQNLADEVMTTLESLQGETQRGKRRFDRALEKALGEELFQQHQRAITTYAEKKIQRDPDTREILYESAVRVLPRDPVRYREAWQFTFLNTHYVLGARDPDFILAIKDTLVFTIATVFLETVIGMGFALIVNANFPGRGAMRALMLVPWAIPTVISSRAWDWMFNSTRAGFFNAFADMLGVGSGQTAFLQLPSWQLPAMIAIDVWKTTPFMTLLILAGLQLIPTSIYEAANVDGASKLRQFWTITLPMLKPTLAVALVFRTLDALRVFDVFQIVLSQSRYSMASFIYYELINNRAMGYSSAGGVVIFLLIFVFAISYIRILGVQSEGD